MNISRDSRTIIARLLYNNRKTFVSLSYEAPMNVALVSFSFVRQSRDIRERVSRHSYECRLVLISRPSRTRGMFACILKTVMRLSYECSYDIRTTIVRVPRNFRIVNSQNSAATCSQVCVGYG